ncbi:MAG: DHHA1 domain-containing protein [Gemmataceae bacterium]
MISLIRSLDGIEVALFFMEQPAGGVKVSFRSRQKVDVAKIAEKFGGGGHRLASGSILDTSMELAQQHVLAAVRAEL